MQGNSQQAIGWALYAPSSSGGKLHVTLLVDNYYVVGWGIQHSYAPMSFLQWKVKELASAKAAQTTAVNMTMQKEAKGYTMSTTPRRNLGTINGLPPAKVLGSLLEHRGRHAPLALFADTILSGAEV